MVFHNNFISHIQLRDLNVQLFFYCLELAWNKSTLIILYLLNKQNNTTRTLAKIHRNFG